MSTFRLESKKNHTGHIRLRYAHATKVVGMLQRTHPGSFKGMDVPAIVDHTDKLASRQLEFTTMKPALGDMKNWFALRYPSATRYVPIHHLLPGGV